GAVTVPTIGGRRRHERRVTNERSLRQAPPPGGRLLPSPRPPGRTLLDERREALAHLVGGERSGEHREVDRGELAVQVALERRPRLRTRRSHPLDRLAERRLELRVGHHPRA